MPETETIPTRNPHVLHVGKFYPPHMGGIERHMQAMAEGQSRRTEVSVLVASDGPRTVTSVVNGVFVTRVGSLGVAASQPVCPGLAWHIHKVKADIVHLHLPNPAAAAAYLASGRRGPLVVTHHSDILGRPLLGRLVQPIMRRLMDRAAIVITTSGRYARSSRELVPFLAKCRTVPLGIDAAHGRSYAPDAVASVRKRFGTTIVLAVGRLVPYKGFEHLIRAMESVAATLVIIGSGPLRQALQRLIEDCRLSRVHLAGHVEDLTPYYHAAEMVVLPSVSRAEAFGLVQLEAMAAAKPVINTDLDSGVPEVSIHGKTGLTVPPRSHRALADAMNLLLSNPEQRLHYGMAGLRRVQTEFSLDTMIERSLDVYREAQEQSKRSRSTGEEKARAAAYQQPARNQMMESGSTSRV